MPVLRMRLFSNVEAFVEGTPLRFPTKKAKSLCAFLATFRARSFSRSFLAAQFWPDSEEARAQRSLNTELWRLRTLFKQAGIDPQDLLETNETISLRASESFTTDLATFEALTSVLAAGIAGDTEATHPAMALLELYSGDLAEDLFDDWCSVPREHYRTRFAGALENLVNLHHAAGRHHDTITVARRLLQHDPLLEHAHRTLIDCHLKLGHRAAALKQYAECAAILRSELHIAPLPETRALVEGLEAAPPAPIAPHRLAQQLAAELQAQPFEVALASLSTARTLLEEAITQLQARHAVASVRTPPVDPQNSSARS